MPGYRSIDSIKIYQTSLESDEVDTMAGAIIENLATSRWWWGSEGEIEGICYNQRKSRMIVFVKSMSQNFLRRTWADSCWRRQKQTETYEDND